MSVLVFALACLGSVAAHGQCDDGWEAEAAGGVVEGVEGAGAQVVSGDVLRIVKELLKSC